MIRTIFFFFILWLILLLSFIVYVPIILLKILKFQKILEYFLLKVSHFWGKATVYSTFSRVSVYGIENVPKNENVAFVGNHQSNMDIPLMLGFSPIRAGFLAKKELDKVPIFRRWMRMLGCVFVDRKNLRDSLTAAMKTIRKIKEEHSMIIFPEGTRSRSNTMGRFKEGSIRFLINENVTIVPFTVIDTYKTYEEQMNANNANIQLYFHPPINTEKITVSDFKDFLSEIRSVIEQPLPKN
jgi:1-acyl-sn-glycerol-3-phosphate acyltransferase